MRVLFFILLLIFSACGELKDLGEQIGEIDGVIRPEETPVPDKPVETFPTPSPTPAVTENPILGEQTFLDGNEGNLWKPVSDSTSNTGGNLVVTLTNKIKKEFSEGCFVETKSGKQERLFCGGHLVCFANPDRLTLRSNIKCGEAKEVKVTCREAKQTVIFTVPKAKRNQVCQRHD